MMKDFGAYAVFAAEYTAPARKMFDVEHIFVQGHKIQTQAIITAKVISTLVLFLLHFTPAAALIALSLIRLCF